MEMNNKCVSFQAAELPVRRLCIYLFSLALKKLKTNSVSTLNCIGPFTPRAAGVKVLLVFK